MSRLARRRLGKFEKGENRMYLCEVFLLRFLTKSLNVHKSIEKAVDIFRVAFILLFLLESFFFFAFEISATKAEEI